MCKLNLDIIEKIKDLTGAEIDSLLYFSRLQDEFSCIRDIHYKKTCIALGFSKTTFYNALYGLEEKGVIQIDYTNKKDWSVTILQGHFMDYRDFRKGYVNTNKDFLHTVEFRALRKQEKQLCLQLLKVHRNQCYKISIAKLSEWIGSSEEKILEYLDNISQFFVFQIKGQLVCFQFLPFSAQKTEKEHRYTHFLTAFCGKYRIGYTTKDIEDLIILLGQYKNKIRLLISTICDTALKYKSLEPRLINAIISKA